MKLKVKKILSVILVVSIIVTMFIPNNTFAEELKIKDELYQEEDVIEELLENEDYIFENTIGDLTIDELKTAILLEEDIPEIIDRELIAQNEHVNRLYVQEPDDNTVVFQNRDGSKTMYYFNDPVKYRDQRGIPKDKSNKIVESKQKNHKYQNVENDILTLFPEKLSLADGISLKYENYNLELIPQITEAYERDTEYNKSQISKYKNNDKDTDSVKYDNVFGENISLRYTPTFMGFKEDIILDRYTGINTFTFLLKTNGLELICNKDQQYYLIDCLTGELIVKMSEIIISDSGEDSDIAYGSIEVEEIKADNEYLLTITVDEEYLKNEDTVYPVYIDPSFDIIENYVIESVAIYNGTPNQNYGANPYLHVGYYDSTNKVGRVLIKPRELMQNSLYRSILSKDIISVDLYLYEISSNGGSSDIMAYAFKEYWLEECAKYSNINWNNYYSTPATTNKIPKNNVLGKIDITQMAKDWKDSKYPYYGIILKNSDESTTGNKRKGFASSRWSDATKKPYVTVTWVTSVPSGENINNTTYYIQNVFSDKYLTNNGSMCSQTSILSYTEYQKYKFVQSNTSNYFWIFPENNANKCLYLNTNDDIVLSTDGYNDRAKWRVVNQNGNYWFVNRFQENFYGIAISGDYTTHRVSGKTYFNSQEYWWKLKKAVTDIKICPLENITIYVDEKVPLWIELVPNGAFGSGVTWNSVTPNIATVNNSGVVTGRAVGTATINATCDGIIKTKTIKVVEKDKTFDIISSLSRPEYYYIMYPSGISSIPFFLNIPESPIIAGLTFKEKLLTIPISRKYHGKSVSSSVLASELNAAIGRNYFTSTRANMIYSQYGLAVSPIPIMSGMPAYRYTPESIQQAQSNYMQCTDFLIKGYLFILAAELNPFDANGDIKFKQDQYEKYRDPSTGKWIYPSKDGFDGNIKEIAITEGGTFDRYGNTTGKFGSPVGTPMSNRSLPPTTNMDNYHVYMVKSGKQIFAKSGLIAPWFCQPGGGTQYLFYKTIEEMLIEGLIEEITYLV